MAPSEASDPGRLVLVYTATSLPEGLIARGLLQTEGVPVFTKGEQEGPYRVGLMHLWVPEGQAERAKEILTAMQAGEGGTEGDGAPHGDGGNGSKG